MSGMAAEISDGESVQFEPLTNDGTDHDSVAEQLQQVYEHVLNGQRPEAVGATEQLAQELDIDVKRPSRFPSQTRR